MVEFARNLVRTPSLSTREGRVAALVADEMRRLGYDVTIDPMGNVIGRIGPGHGKKLLYNGHMDTVDVGNVASWTRDPYAGDVEDGVLYGRGACDMKGALAAMIYAGKALIDSGTPLEGDLYVVAVVQEEPCEGLSMRYIIEEGGLRPDWVVLGEATNLQPARGQRGRIEVEVSILGRAAHAAAPDRGVNAVYGAARAIVAVELLAPQLNHDSFLGKGSIAVTEIYSTAGSRNAVPDCCSLYIDRRLTIGETETKALAEIRRILSREGVNATVDVPLYRSTSYTGYEAEARQYFPYWITSEDEPLLLTATGIIEHTLEYSPRIGRWDFSTDGVYTSGVAGIPTIGFGPGEERYSHTVDDQVRLADIHSAARVYAALAERMLRVKK
jgi:putative selenium metabolism hydrolase